MAAHTILFDFSVNPEKTADAHQRQDVAKIIRNELENIFPQLEFAFCMTTEDGHFGVLSENKATIITFRIFQHGLITINVEYYLEDGKEPLMSFDVNFYLVLLSYFPFIYSSYHSCVINVNCFVIVYSIKEKLWEAIQKIHIFTHL